MWVLLGPISSGTPLCNPVGAGAVQVPAAAISFVFNEGYLAAGRPWLAAMARDSGYTMDEFIAIGGYRYLFEGDAN